MKVGDLVRAFKSSRGAGKMGVVVRLFEKKIWRTESAGHRGEIGIRSIPSRLPM